METCNRWEREKGDAQHSGATVAQPTDELIAFRRTAFRVAAIASANLNLYSCYEDDIDDVERPIGPENDRRSSSWMNRQELPVRNFEAAAIGKVQLKRLKWLRIVHVLQLLVRHTFAPRRIVGKRPIPPCLPSATE
jgi:hypothetical protein